MRLKAALLPYYETDVDKLLDSLATAGFIIRYHSDGQRFIQVVTFGSHQCPNVKEPASTIPAPCQDGASTSLIGREGKEEEIDLLSGKPDVEESPKRGNGLTGFGDFYASFPRHEKRGDAEKAWKAAKDRPPLPDLLAAVDRYKLSPKVTEGLVMLPASWLRSKSWLDEYPPPDREPTRFGVL
jgi:hypothetical protein